MAERENGQSDRVDYAVAGAAQRDATERALQLASKDQKLRLTSKDKSTLLAVFSSTTTWSKLTDRVYIEEIAEIAGVHRSDAGKSLRKLADLGIIDWESTPGRREKSQVGIPASTSQPRATGTSGDLGPLVPQVDPQPRVNTTLTSGHRYLSTEKDREEGIGLPAAAGPSKVDRVKTISAVAELAAAAADTNDEKSKSKGSTYEHVVDLDLAVGAQAVGGAAGVDEADRVVGRDVDDQELDIDAVPTAAPVPTELATALEQLRGDVNESTKVQAVELYAINAGAILAKIAEARGAHKPGAYLNAAFKGMVAGNELEAPIRAPDAASVAVDPERIKNNARAYIARIRAQHPDYPHLREDLAKDYKLEPHVVDELLAENPMPAPDEPAPKGPAYDDDAVGFADVPAEIRAKAPTHAPRTTETYEELPDDEKAELDRLEHEYAQAITKDSDIN